MGNLTSKCRLNKSKSKDCSDSIKRSTQSSNSQTESELYDDWIEDQELKILRRTLELNPELFILNNLMLSVQFFENFDEEIAQMRQTLIPTREIDINARLPPQKHALIPDVLQERVSKNIDFFYLRPSQIRLVEPLQPIRIYIVFDNIEVTEQSFASPYCTVNETVTYNVQLKSSKHKGYAFLQRLEVNPSKKNINPARDEAIYSDGDSLYGDNKANDSNIIASIDKTSGGSGSSSLTSPSEDLNDEESIYYEREDDYPEAMTPKQKKPQQKKTPRQRQYPKALLPSPGGSLSSGYRSGTYIIDSDSECAYGGSTVSVQSKPNSIPEGPFTAELSRQCFQIHDQAKKRRQRLNNKDKIIKGMIYSHKYDVWYLVSAGFMEHFKKIFTHQLSAIMGFNSDIHDAVHGAVIYRDKIEVLETRNGTKEEQFAILPCIWCPWPDIAYEWLQRPRATWPDYNVIEKIKEIGCYLIPEGYGSETTINPDRNFEWELTFPAAERYLDTCLTYSQVRVYLMALVLQKTFIRSDSYVGLTDSQIKNQLFWLIEENDSLSKWMDVRMGEALLRLLNSLYRAISQDVPVMHDYFVKDKNIFQGKIYLLRTQKQLKRIIENPVMYLLYAMQNIKHSRSFFPKLNYTELLNILTEDILTLMNPRLLRHQAAKVYPKSTSGENDYDHVGFWDSAKQNNERTSGYNRKPVTNRTLIDPRTSYDQVLEITVRCAEMEPQRLCLLLDLFIKHFIQIAEYCHKYGALSQKKVYIEQAERLAILLSEHYSYKDKAKAYRNTLRVLKRRVATSRSQSNPPETPRRNVDNPIFTSTLRDRYQTVAESQAPSVHIATPADIQYSSDPYRPESTTSPLRVQSTVAVIHELPDENPGNDERKRKSSQVQLPASEDTYI